MRPVVVVVVSPCSSTCSSLREALEQLLTKLLQRMGANEFMERWITPVAAFDDMNPAAVRIAFDVEKIEPRQTEMFTEETGCRLSHLIRIAQRPQRIAQCEQQRLARLRDSQRRLCLVSRGNLIGKSQGGSTKFQEQADYEFAASFGEGSLFIDDCPDSLLDGCYIAANGDWTSNWDWLGFISSGNCWNSSTWLCEPCGSYSYVCNETYDGCQGGCRDDIQLCGSPDCGPE